MSRGSRMWRSFSPKTWRGCRCKNSIAGQAFDFVVSETVRVAVLFDAEACGFARPEACATTLNSRRQFPSVETLAHGLRELAWVIRFLHVVKPAPQHPVFADH